MRQGEPKKHCPNCNTGSCFYKILLDGTLRHFCACRRTYWDWDAPPSSEELLSNLSDNIKEIHRLWMKSPDWCNTEEGAQLLIRLFELVK